MSVFYHFWKIWLRMDKSGREVSAESLPELTTQNIVKSNKDIAERLSKEGVEVNYSTLTYIVDQYDRIVRDMICEGYSVKTNNIHFVPQLSGGWTMDSLAFDPQKHKCSLKCIPSQELQRAMSFVGVRVLGFKDTSSFISHVKDVVSGEIDSIATRNNNIMIEGSGIEAIGGDGSTANCIFLKKENKDMIDISNSILINSESQIVLRLPSNLEIGKYQLLIYTYYSKRNKNKDTYCKCIEFDKPLIVR